MQWPPLKGTLVPHEGKNQQSENEKAILWLPSTLPIDWQWVTQSKADSPEISVFLSELPPCRGDIKNKDLGLWCRRGLLANVSVGVSVQLNALVAGNGSYILRPCDHDIHGPTLTIKNGNMFQSNEAYGSFLPKNINLI